MLLYTILIIILGLIVGKYTSIYLGKCILPIVFFLVYPGMVNLSLEHLKKVKEVKKTVITALIMNFVFTPLLMWFLCYIFHINHLITFGLVLLAIGPASSMGMGYIGLSGGNMLSGSITAGLAFLLSLIVYPLFFHFVLIGKNGPIPVKLLVKNLIFVLVIPLILGILTREYIERTHKEGTFQKIKPVFSLMSIIALYLLIFVIFESKAKIVIIHWRNLFVILLPVLLFYLISIFASLHINNKVLKLEYDEHQSIVFTSIAKNIALTIAILIAMLGEKGSEIAIYIIMMSLIQPIILMVYLKQQDKIKKFFNN